MNKMKWLFMALICGTACAITSEEESNLSSAVKDAFTADNYSDVVNFTDAAKYYDQCANRLDAAITKNPALADARISEIRTPTSALELRDYCKGQSSELKISNTPALRTAVAKLNDIYSKGRFGDTSPVGADVGLIEKCISQVPETLKTYPILEDRLVNVPNDNKKITFTQMVQECNDALVRANLYKSEQTSLISKKIIPIKLNFDKTLALFQTIRNRPENSAGAVLTKYRDLGQIDEKFQSYVDGVREIRDPALQNVKIGNTTAGAFLAQLNTAKAQSAAALAALKPKSDRAFDQQDAQINATMPKITNGGRLAIFKRYGIPYNWTGGQTFSKNGVYSGDGVALAKDLASATKWLYNQDSNGCYHYFTFNKNALVKTEKPYGCD